MSQFCLSTYSVSVERNGSQSHFQWHFAFEQKKQAYNFNQNEERFLCAGSTCGVCENESGNF